MAKTHYDIQKAIRALDYYYNLVGEDVMLEQVIEGTLPDTIRVQFELLLKYTKNLV